MPRPAQPQTFHVRKRGSLSSDEDSLTLSASTAVAASPALRKTKDKGANTRSSSRRKRYRVSHLDEEEEEDDDEDDDEEYALAAANADHQTNVTQASVPAFLHKLYSMIDEPTTDKHVRWSENGKSFIVEDHEGFAKTILPLYYKHCKFASFVRQLNMYDFHKIPAVQQGALFANNQHDLWEFSHEHFYRGCNDKLALVTRKRNKNLESSTARRSLTLAKLVRDIASIRKHQAGITSDLTSLQSDNATLWQESFAAREKHQQHQDVLNKILQFLTTVFSNEDNFLHATAQQLRGPFMLGKDNEYISLTGQPGGQETKSPTHLIEEAASLVGMTPPSTVKRETKQPDDDHQQQSEEALDSLSSSLGGGSSRSSQAPTTSDISNPFPDPFNRVSCSAESITQDIDNLEDDIEKLASHIGIDSNGFGEVFDYNEQMSDFRHGYGSMIAGASRSDMIQLFELAGGSHVKNRYDGEGTLKNNEPVSATTNSNDDSLYRQQSPLSAIPPSQHHPYSNGSMTSHTSSQPTTSSLHADLFQSFYHGISMAQSGNQPHYVAVPVPIPVPVSVEQYNAATAANSAIPGNQQRTTMAHVYPTTTTTAAAAAQQQQSVNQASYSPDGPLDAQQSHKGHATYSNQSSVPDNN